MYGRSGVNKKMGEETGLRSQASMKILFFIGVMFISISLVSSSLIFASDLDPRREEILREDCIAAASICLLEGDDCNFCEERCMYEGENLFTHEEDGSKATSTHCCKLGLPGQIEDEDASGCFPSLTINIDGSGDESNYGEGETYFEYGEEIDLEEDPASGWVFSEWSGDCTGKDCTLTMDEDKEVTAHFDMEEYFEVGIGSVNEPYEGENLEVSVGVENVGVEEATQTIELDVPGLGTDSDSRTIPGGSSEVFSLYVSTSSGDAGSYTATVSSEDDEDSEGVTVKEQEDAEEFSLSCESPSISRINDNCHETGSGCITECGDSSCPDAPANSEMVGSDDCSSYVAEESSCHQIEEDTYVCAGGRCDTTGGPCEYECYDGYVWDSDEGECVEKADPAYFEVIKRDGSTYWDPDGVENEDESSVRGEVINQGDEYDCQDIYYDAGFDHSDGDEVCLDGGESTGWGPYFELMPGSGDAGSYTGEYYSEDDSWYVDFEVYECEPGETEDCENCCWDRYCSLDSCESDYLCNSGERECQDDGTWGSCDASSPDCRSECSSDSDCNGGDPCDDPDCQDPV